MPRRLFYQWQMFASFSLDPSKCQTSRICRWFRSKAALDALHRASEEKIPTLVLYNYPSYPGAFAALFAHLFHSRLRLPFLILPFSSVEPLRPEDLGFAALERCYILDFFGPKGFALRLSEKIPQVIAFDHRNSTLAKISEVESRQKNLFLHINPCKSSSLAVHDYFSSKLVEEKPPELLDSLVSPENSERLMMVLNYIEDCALRSWALPDIKAFSTGLREARLKLNYVSNPYLFDQLLQINATELIGKGKSYISSRKDAAKKLLGKVFKIRLGRGLYGECLGTRADGNSEFTNELSEDLSLRSARMGLRPIGAVVYMQRGNLKMCLRSTDGGTDTSEIAKAYGGGGCAASSSFIIRMDEYNEWISVNWS